MGQTATIPDQPSVEIQPRRAPRSTALFWVVAGIPLAMLFLAFVLIRTTPFRAYADNYWVDAQRGLFVARNQDCPILIYGDSTAMAGLDPRIIAADTGMKACNIAATGGVLSAMGLEPLDGYLSRNPRPKVLFLLFSADSLLPAPTRGGSFDGYIQMIRFDPWTHTLYEMLRQPDNLIGLMHYVYDQGLRNLANRARHGQPARALDSGSYFVHPEPAMQRCSSEAANNRDPDPSWIRSLRARYTPQADRLILDVAPVPPCGARYQRWSGILRGLTDNQLEILPLTDFVDEASHMTRSGAVTFSSAAAGQILNQPTRDQSLGEPSRSGDQPAQHRFEQHAKVANPAPAGD